MALQSTCSTLSTGVHSSAFCLPSSHQHDTRDQHAPRQGGPNSRYMHPPSPLIPFVLTPLCAHPAFFCFPLRAPPPLLLATRDLHVGNVLVRPTAEKTTALVVGGRRVHVPTGGFEARIIDFTLSRISAGRIDPHKRHLHPRKSAQQTEGEGARSCDCEGVQYFDLEDDPDIFCGEGNIQFDVYRDMRALAGGDWLQVEEKGNKRGGGGGKGEDKS